MTVDPSTEAPQTVLYIEDNPALAMYVERVLKTHRPGVTLLAAGTGARGLALASEMLPSLVLLDLFLPDINGEVVLRTIRRDERTSGLRVIILTGPSTADRHGRLRVAGADDVLTKPLGIRDLLAVIDGAPIGQIGPVRSLPHPASGPVDPVRLHDLRRVHPDPESWSTFLDAFVRDCHGCVERLARAAHARDADAVARCAHELAGLCSLVGDGDVLPILVAIQLAALRGHLPGDRQVAALEEAFRVTERALATLPDR